MEIFYLLNTKVTIVLLLFLVVIFPQGSCLESEKYLGQCLQISLEIDQASWLWKYNLIYIPWKTVNPSFQFCCYFVFELFSFTDTYVSFLLELFYLCSNKKITCTSGTLNNSVWLHNSGSLLFSKAILA